MTNERGLYLGRRVEAPQAPVRVDPADLTTHGVVVGMTGSGKTGLLMSLLEECLLAGIPALALDPKGDLSNIFLNFPGLTPQEFLPWIDPEEARRAGRTPEDEAARTAALWRTGLEKDGDDVARIGRLREIMAGRLFTPGSDAGLPVNIVSGFEPPALSWDRDAEVIRERIASLVSALLTRAGEDADPLQSPAHIFLANLLEDRWRVGERPGLAEILGYLIHPPFAKLGVLHVDTFYSPAARTATRNRLNALLASPAFAAWQTGTPLDVERFLAAPSGRTPLSVFYTAHLGDEDRQMFAALLLAEVVSWMRRQPGTGSLRLLVLLDEVWGLMPPHPADPPAKRPLLTLLKQARAFGVGVVVATQNPVDLDYKGLSNAGLWCVGRLSTDQDKARLLDGLAMVAGTAERTDNDRVISALAPRQFLMRNVHDPAGSGVFRTRWALSYLRGPLTRDEVRRLATSLTPAPAAPAAPAAAFTPPAPAPAPATVPGAAPGVPARYLDPRALQPDRASGYVKGAQPGPPRRYRPALLGRAGVRFDDTASGLEHRQTEWRLIFPLEGSSGWRWPAEDAPDLSGELQDVPLPGVPHEALPPALESARTFEALARDLKDHLLAQERITLFASAALRLYSKVGESREAFEARLRSLAQDQADQEIAALRDRYLARERKLRDRVERESLDVDRVRAEVGARKTESMLSLGEGILGMVLGGRRSTRVLSQASRSQRMAGSAQARLRKEEAEHTSAQAELEALEAELTREVEARRAKAEQGLSDLREVAVGLERDDVQVEEVALLWVPDAAL